MPVRDEQHEEQLALARQWQDPSEWQTAAGARTVTRRLATLVTKHDTEGDTKWRTKQRADGIVRLPVDFAPVEQKAARHGRDRRIGNPIMDNFPQLQEISQQLDVTLVVGAEFNRYRASKGLLIELWGKPADVQEARMKINAWVAELHGKADRRANKFFKLTSQERQKQQEKELEKYNVKRAYCQDPSMDEDLPCMGTFIWPETLGRPEKALGQNFEALDSIRMEEQSYIECNRTTMLFRVRGVRPKNVKRALMRLRAVFYHLSAAQLEPQTKYILEPRGNTTQPMVKLVPYEKGKGGEAPSMSPVPSGTPEPVSLIDSRIGMDFDKAQNNKEIKMIALKTLAGLRYYRGNLSMRVRLGNFVLTQYLKGTEKMPRLNFEVMMKDPSVRGEITQSFPGDFKIVHLEAGMRPTTSNIEPMNPNIRTKLRDGNFVEAFEPFITATVIVKDRDDMLRLDLEYYPDQNDHMERRVTRWSRSDQPDGSLRKLLDVNAIDIDNETAWNLEIETSSIVSDERMPILSKYASGITVTRDRDQLRDPTTFPLLLELPSSSQIKLHSLTQRKMWRYRFPRSDYVAELALCREFKATNPGSILATKFNAELPIWTLHVTSDVWAQLLDQNGVLAMGEGVDWKADAGMFFPPLSAEMEDQPGRDGFPELVGLVEGLGWAMRSGKRSA